jgi:hypothetical protein
MSNDENYTGGGTRPKARRQASKVNDRFRNAETGERAKASQKDVVEWAKQVTDNNPNFWAKEENDPNRWHLGHDLLNPYKKGKGSLTPTHYVDKYLNEIAEKLMSSGKVQKSALKDGEDYTPILKYILENPSDPVVAPIYKNRPEIIGSTLPDAAEKLGANHLMRFA